MTNSRTARTLIPLLVAVVGLTTVLAALVRTQSPATLVPPPFSLAGQPPAVLPIDHSLSAPGDTLLARTSQEAVYATEDGYRSVLSAAPTHYQDPGGQWQPIDPAFVASAEEFSVAANTLTSRSGRHRAWVAAGAGELALNWQATGLAAAGRDGLTVLAHPLDEGGDRPGQRSEDGRLLRYEDSWSDPAVAEWLISEAGSLEHLLVLNERPAAPAGVTDLVMTAELLLSPGAELWAEGEHQTGPFTTGGRLEIRLPDHDSGLALEPVLAYEVEDMAEAVAGEYALRPGEEPDSWLVEVRTPWAWWADPGRAYPAAIDPRIVVMRTTGQYSQGAAFVSNYTDAFDPGGRIRLGPYFSFDELTRGYVQFNTLPALLVNNGPLQITNATLRVHPAGYWAPHHEQFSTLTGASKGQNFLFSDGFQMSVELRWIGSCPEAPACDGLDLDGAPPSLTFADSPDGVRVEPIQPMKAQKATDSSQTLQPPDVHPRLYRPLLGDPIYTSWDVTDRINDWYALLYNPLTVPGTQGRPTFMLRLNPAVACPPGPYYDEKEDDARKCAAFDIPPENIELIIDYQPLDLPAGEYMTNTLGAPSWNQAVFAGSEVVNGDLQTTDHLYRLTDTGAPRWRAVAARGDHLRNPAPDSDIGLQLWQYPLSDDGALDKPLADSGRDAAFTQVLFIDERHAPGGAADLRAAVEASGPVERDAMDTAANYRIQHLAATGHNVLPSAVTPIFSTLRSDQLVALHEFELNSQDNVKISVSIPLTAPLQFLFIQPTAGSDNFVVSEPTELNRKDGVITFNDTVLLDGVYALAIVNLDRPYYPPPPADPLPLEYPFQIRITRCDRYSIPVDRFLGPPTNMACQPIPLPLYGGGLESNHMRYVRIDDSPEKWLLVHNLGGFIEELGDDVWCTTSEHMGTPVVAALSPYEEPPPGLYEGDWVVVGQGSVCLADGGQLEDGHYFGALRTTDLSAVGLATLEGSPALPERRGVFRKFMFGRTDFPVDSTAHGETVVTPSGDFIAQNVNTWTAFDPFRSYWAGNTTGVVPPAISTDEMAFLGRQLVDAVVNIDFDQPPVEVGWDVAWRVEPIADPAPSGQPNYNFIVQTLQKSPLPALSTFSGLELRVQPTSEPGWITDMDWTALGGPNVYRFRANDSRVTADDALGRASQVNAAIITPPGRSRVPAGELPCRLDGYPISCLDLRDPVAAGNWDPIFGEQTVAPWRLPDLQITGETGAILFDRPGRFEAFSTDHPDSLRPEAVNVPFSFDTWGGEVNISEGPCGGGGPPVTLVKGTGYIALPMIGGEGAYPGQNPISMRYTLCETELHEVTIEFIPPAPVPIASSGLEATLLRGTVIIGPDSTRITLQVNFQSSDGGATLNDGLGAITLDTAGLLAIDAKGKLVGNFNADFQLAVAWNPLDLLLQGDVRYRNSNLITGYLRLHAWRGSGWQNKYPWINDTNLHFTGRIGGEVSIPRGELINKKYFKIPPFTLSKGADISFGEFCRNSNCTPPFPWGVAATVSIFGYKAGVYVDSGGPEIILGTKGKTLIDQYGGGAMSVPEAGDANGGGEVVITPGLQQQLLLPDWSSPVITPTDSTVCQTAGSQVTCPLTVVGGSGRANFSAFWLNGDLDVRLIHPNGTIYSGSNIAAGVVYSETVNEGVNAANYLVTGTAANGMMASGEWRVRLNNVGVFPPPLTGNANNWSILFTADPPAPTLAVTSPAGQGAPGSGNFNITWQATGTPPAENLDLELFYAPAFAPEPLPPDDLFVTFPGDYAEQIGGSDWDPGDPAVQGSDGNSDGVYRFTTNLTAGDYAFKVAVGGTWAETYGRDGVANGADIFFTAPAGGDPVHFYYDRRDNFITTRPDSDIVVLVGDMMAELGGADWAPANLVGWLKPGDEARYVLDLKLPVGDWEYKVAMNESWAVNYGQNGIPNGPNIPLHVPVDGATVRFTYDAVSHIISHTILAQPAGIPIRFDLDPNTGSYLWDTTGLASGEYLVGGRINDIRRANGVITDWAPGTVLIEDNTPPPVPANVELVLYNGLELTAAWDRDFVTPDLAGYVIDYWIPGYDYDVNPPNRLPRELRVLPMPGVIGYRQWAHLTGIMNAALDDYEGSTICVSAYDASGNLSDCEHVPLSFPMPDNEPLPAPSWETFVVEPVNGDHFFLEWTQPPEAGGYLLRYGPAGCVVPEAATIADEGPSAIVLPAQLDFELHGLTPAQLYWFEVAAIDEYGLPGQPVRAEAMLLDGPDNNGDGLPDAWAAYYGLVSPGGDRDQDGLDNLGEYQQFSNPLHADSDGDGFYDSYELEWGTDVCGPEQPPYHTQPVLTIFGQQHYNLRTATNQGPAGDTLEIVNFGAGQMFWQVSTNVSWLTFDRNSGSGDATVTFAANPAGLPPGFYNTTVSISTLSPPGMRAAFIGETAEVEVTFVVMPEMLSSLFLPVMSR